MSAIMDRKQLIKQQLPARAQPALDVLGRQV
jgi:hypothetical protein